MDIFNNRGLRLNIMPLQNYPGWVCAHSNTHRSWWSVCFSLSNYLISLKHFPMSHCLCSWQKCPLLQPSRWANSSRLNCTLLNLLSLKIQKTVTSFDKWCLNCAVNKLTSDFSQWILKCIMESCCLLMFFLLLFFFCHVLRSSVSTLAEWFPCCSIV